MRWSERRNSVWFTPFTSDESSLLEFSSWDGEEGCLHDFSFKGPLSSWMTRFQEKEETIHYITDTPLSCMQERDSFPFIHLRVKRDWMRGEPVSCLLNVHHFLLLVFTSTTFFEEEDEEKRPSNLFWRKRKTCPVLLYLWLYFTSLFSCCFIVVYLRFWMLSVPLSLSFSLWREIPGEGQDCKRIPTTLLSV